MCSTSRCLVAAVVVAQFAARLILLAEGRLSPMSSGMDSGMGSGTNNLPTSDPSKPILVQRSSLHADCIYIHQWQPRLQSL